MNRRTLHDILAAFLCVGGMVAAVVAGATLAGIPGCVSEAPAWIRTHVHPDYAGSSFLVGVGSCAVEGLPESEYREAAQRRAFAEIAAQIRTRVTAGWQESTHTSRVGSDVLVDTAFLSEKELSSSEFLEGVRIADVHHEAASGVYYAFAVLDVATFARNLSSRILRAAETQADLGARCRHARDERAWGTAVSLFADLGDLKRRREADLALLRVIDLEAALRCGRAASMQAPLPVVDFSIELVAMSGQDQRGLPGYPLEEPIVLRASVRPFEEESTAPEPLAGIPVVLSGDAPCDPCRVTTDAGGQAVFSVVRIPRQQTPLSLSFAADLPGAAAMGLAAQTMVRIPVVNRTNLRLGLVLSLPERDRRGTAWVLERLTSGLVPLGPIKRHCVVTELRDSEKAVRSVDGVDLVVFTELRLDLLLFGQSEDFFSSEARLRFRLWSPHAHTWLWAGGEAKAVGAGGDALSAAEHALLRAVRAGMPGLRAAVASLLDG